MILFKQNNAIIADIKPNNTPPNVYCINSWINDNIDDVYLSITTIYFLLNKNYIYHLEY